MVKNRSFTQRQISKKTIWQAISQNIRCGSDLSQNTLVDGIQIVHSRSGNILARAFQAALIRKLI